MYFTFYKKIINFVVLMDVFVLTLFKRDNEIWDEIVSNRSFPTLKNISSGIENY